MIKFRSMIVNADANKVDSTSSGDEKNKFSQNLRRFKIDETLLNVTFKEFCRS